MTAEITIIITCFNEEKYLSACLNSIIQQTFIHWDVLIIDDGSTDDSVAIAQSFADKDSRISIVANEINQGHYASINKALNLTESSYFTRVDADDTLHPSYLARCYHMISNNTGLGAVFVNFKYFDQQGESSSNYPIEVSDKTFGIADILEEGSLQYQGSFFEDSLTNYFRGIGLMRTALVKEFGGFEEWRSEADLLMYLKLASKTKIHCINQALYNYRRHEDSATAKIFHEKEDLIWKKNLLLCANKFFLQNGLLETNGFQKQKKSIIREYYRHCINRSRKSLKFHLALFYAAKLVLNILR
ncbi:glycosyltransferase family 2 protein [Reichenbachiella sp.]|uniref:glycosyltransferase family 2 protein n=1 Tax=Reichenbachiella sp. TaxID=2184521 RepID=UPI003B5B02A7